MTGMAAFGEGVAILRASYPQIRLLYVTAGEHGHFCYYDKIRHPVPVMQTNSFSIWERLLFWNERSFLSASVCYSFHNPMSEIFRTSTIHTMLYSI